jgi:integrase
LADADRA